MIWLRDRWNLSTKFPCGEYAGVVVFLIWSLSHNCVQILFTNSPPWSVWILVGHPNLVIHPSMRALATTSASLQGIVTAVTYLVKPSIIVVMYLFPLAVSGRGPTRSIYSTSPGYPCLLGWCVVACRLVFWILARQSLQFLTFLLRNSFIPGQ